MRRLLGNPRILSALPRLRASAPDHSAVRCYLESLDIRAYRNARPTAAHRWRDRMSDIVPRVVGRFALKSDAVARHSVSVFLSALAVICIHGSIAGAEREVDLDVQRAISKWQSYENVLAMRATFGYERLTVDSAGISLDAILKAFDSDQRFESAESLRNTADRIIDSEKDEDGVSYLKLTLRLSSDGQRVRNEYVTRRTDRAARETVHINDGTHNMEYRPSNLARKPGDIGVFSAATGPRAHDINELVPRKLVKLVRDASVDQNAELSSSAEAHGTRVEFRYPGSKVAGTVDFDGDCRIVRSHVDYGSYVEATHFANYSLTDGIELPRLIVTTIARRRGDGMLYKGRLVVVDIAEVQVNPELGDAEFKLAAPARTGIRKLDARGRQAERVLAAQPVEDVSTAVDDLQSLGKRGTTEDAHGPFSASVAVVVGVGVLSVLLTFAVYSRRKRHGD